MRAPEDDPVVRLLAYWLRAKLMHEHMHTLINVYRDRPGQARLVTVARIFKEGRQLEFETYLSYWLSALFVVEQGLGKLLLNTDDLYNLFKEHSRSLKKLRQETYDFSVGTEGLNEMVKQLEWCERLHSALRNRIGEIARHLIEQGML